MASPHGPEPKVYRAGVDVVSASDLAARGQEQKRLGRLTITAPGRIDSTAAGIHIALPPAILPKWFRITGTGTGDDAEAHSTVEVVPIGFNVFADVPDGIVGDATVTPLFHPLYSSPPGFTFEAGDVVLAFKGIVRAESGQVVQEWHAIKGAAEAEEAAVALVRVSSTTEDGAGYQPGFVQTYDTATNAYADSGSAILIRNANRAIETPEKLSARKYLAIKIGSESAVDVYHTLLGAVCVDGTFTR